MDALNALQQNIADTAEWYETSRYCLELGDYKGAAYAMEQVVLQFPLLSHPHCQLGEVYATLEGVENLQLARKHMAQSLELYESKRRALFQVGLGGQCLPGRIFKNKKNEDNHNVEVATEVVKYGVEKVINACKGTKMFDVVQRVMHDKIKSL